MSKVAKQLRHSFNSPIRKSAKTLNHNLQKLSESKKSINSPTERQDHNVTNDKVIKRNKLVRQKTVNAIETENKKSKSSSQDTEEIKLATEWQEAADINEHFNDYQIYENGKVKEFFESKILERPQKVADICLVNDHYILVRMPEQDTLSLADKEFQTGQTLKEKEKDTQKFCQYLRSKRHRITKIAPIREEPEEEFSDEENKTKKTQSKLICLKCWPHNELEVEIYQTQTKICKTVTSNDCDQQKRKRSENLDTQNPSEAIPTISGTLLKSSLPCQVSLHKYGSLIDSHMMVNNNNNNNNNNNTLTPPRRKSLRLESFNWFLRPFRAKYRKPRPKIQAVVYKTYFVKWTKPPDTLTNGFGIKSATNTSNTEMSVLRRCRSAIF